MPVEQQHSLGFAHNIGTPHYDTVLSGGINAIRIQHPHNAGRRTGQKIIIANHDLAHIDRMEGVHVLARINMQQHFLLVVIVALRQRELTEDTVDFRPLVQGVHQLQQGLLACVGRQVKLFAVKAAFLAIPALAAHIDFGGRIIAHQNHRQTRPGSK